MHHGRLDQDTAKGLKLLRKRLRTQDPPIPDSALDQTLNIATWNIREFGKKRRLNQSLHYIAEIMNEFDLIAITELRDKLQDLEKVMSYLGPYWRVVYSDFNTDRRGNRERIGYLYDKRSVVFTGLAAEPDPPRKKDAATGESVPRITWWRSPYMASFRAGNFDFILLAAHIRWDSAGGEKSRVKELKMLADWVEARRRQNSVADKDIIVMGDFNVPDLDNETFKALTSRGLRIPEALTHVVGTNLAKKKRYDQILHFPTMTKAFTDKGGALDFYMGNHKPLFPNRDIDKRDFTYQLSDHLPLWIQVNTDLEDERLDQILNR
jgi:endonuclease/exonuclease/phosphatase family metal-dependent hydrolase